MNRLWMLVGVVNSAYGLFLLGAMGTHFSPDSPLHWWFLVPAPVGLASAVGAWRRSWWWPLLLPLNLLAVPAWLTLGLFTWESLWMGLAGAAVPLGLTAAALASLLRGRVTARRGPAARPRR